MARLSWLTSCYFSSAHSLLPSLLILGLAHTEQTWGCLHLGVRSDSVMAVREHCLGLRGAKGSKLLGTAELSPETFILLPLLQCGETKARSCYGWCFRRGHLHWSEGRGKKTSYCSSPCALLCCCKSCSSHP